MKKLLLFSLLAMLVLAGCSTLAQSDVVANEDQIVVYKSPT